MYKYIDKGAWLTSDVNEAKNIKRDIMIGIMSCGMYNPDFSKTEIERLYNDRITEDDTVVIGVNIGAISFADAYDITGMPIENWMN